MAITYYDELYNSYMSQEEKLELARAAQAQWEGATTHTMAKAKQILDNLQEKMQKKVFLPESEQETQAVKSPLGKRLARKIRACPKFYLLIELKQEVQSDCRNDKICKQEAKLLLEKIKERHEALNA